jgi:hypothetical protein
VTHFVTSSWTCTSALAVTQVGSVSLSPHKLASLKWPPSRARLAPGVWAPTGRYNYTVGDYLMPCDVYNESRVGIAAAVASQADVTILVIGESRFWLRVALDFAQCLAWPCLGDYL